MVQQCFSIININPQQMHLIENDLPPWNIYDLLIIIFQNSWTSFCNVSCFIDLIILLQIYNPDSCSWEHWLLQWHNHKSHAWMKEYFTFVHSCIIGTFFYSPLLWMFRPTLSQMMQCLHGSNVGVRRARTYKWWKWIINMSSLVQH